MAGIGGSFAMGAGGLKLSTGEEKPQIFRPQEFSVDAPGVTKQTPSTYTPRAANQKHNQAWNEWSKKIAQPGLDSTDQLRMRNQAQNAAQADEQRRTKEMENSLANQGLAGTGFGNAALGQLQSESRGNIQNSLAQMDTQNAMTADQNLMNLIGLGGQMASDYGNLQLGYDGLNQREGSDFRNYGLNQQQFYNQQYQDMLAQKNLLADRQTEQQLLNKILAQMQLGGGAGGYSGGRSGMAAGGLYRG